jgi:MFS family permease
MALSIRLMAIGSGIIAFTLGYQTIGVLAPILLIIARLFQGFTVAGEVGPATMFCSRPRQEIGACSSQVGNSRART